MATTRVTGRGPKSPVDEDFLKQLYQGGEMLAQGRLGEARQWLERAHQLQPRNEKGRNLLGLAYFKLGLFERAAEVYEALVRDNPVDATLRVNLGLVYLKTNALQRAMREFEAATDLQPDHKKAHNYLGLALAQAGEYGRAREHFLLAGTDAMAEKMAKAIAGEKFSQPVRAPTPPPSQAPRASSPNEGQWGAQFGLDEVPPSSEAAPPPSPAPPDDEEELRFAEDEGPGALGEDTVSEAPAREAPAPPPPPPEAPRAEPGMARRGALPDSLEGATPELPVRAVAFPAGGGVPTLEELLPGLAISGASSEHPFRMGHGSLSVLVEGEVLSRLAGLVAFSGQLAFQPERRRHRGLATEEPFGTGAGQLRRVRGQGMLYLESAEARTFLAVHLGDEGAYVLESCVFAFEEAVAFDNGRVPSELAPELRLVHLRGQGRVVLSLPGTLRSLPVVPETPVWVPLSHLVGWTGKVTPRVVPLPGFGTSPPEATGEAAGEAAGEGREDGAGAPTEPSSEESSASSPPVFVELSGEGFALIALTVR